MRFAFVMPLVVLASCGEAEPAVGPVQSDAQAVSMVEDANAVIPPAVAILPEPILAADIEAQDMFGATCSYTVRTVPTPILMVRDTDAFMKLNGETIRFAADPGSRELLNSTRSLYNAREYALRLALTNGQGTISLRDAWDREIFSGTGAAQCGA